jgi:hypothetical protein
MQPSDQKSNSKLKNATVCSEKQQSAQKSNSQFRKATFSPKKQHPAQKATDSSKKQQSALLEYPTLLELYPIFLKFNRLCPRAFFEAIAPQWHGLIKYIETKAKCRHLKN